MLTKKKLREQYKAKRATLSEEERDARSLAIANQLLSLPIWDYQYYHLFLSIQRLLEIDTSYILSILNGKDKNVLVSQSDFDTGRMRHILLQDNTVIRLNDYGIPEPQRGIEIPAASIEVIFVPLLAYDQKGHRLGYGKGFYDRLLSEASQQVIAVGLSFFEPETELPEVGSHDIPLTYCVTPENTWEF